MSKIEKLINQFFDRPTSLKFYDIEKVLFHFGFKKIKAKGSHKKFKNPNFIHDLIIPVHNNECKDFYKKFTSQVIKNYLNKN